MRKLFLFFSLFSIPSLLMSQVLWDDFEQNRVGYYDFVHGGMTTRYANPDIGSFVNPSPMCAQYVRNPAELWDVLVILGNGSLDDVSDYVNGAKTMSVDLYSPAAGIPVQITLEDSSLAGPTNYPTGRHSVYLGATTVANAWETVVLTFDSRPDPTAPDAGLSSVILLFNGGTNTGDTYYFDNLYGPELNNQCDGLVNDPIHDFADWDCNWNLSMCPSASACASFDYMSGWLNQGHNPQTNTINTSKYSGEYTRNPDANGEDVFIAYFQDQDLDLGANPYFNMKIYGPPTSLYVSFQNNTSEVIGFQQNIWGNNTWQQLNFDLSSVSFLGISINRVVFFFDQGMVNWDTYFIDDLGISSAPVSIREASLDYALLVYPKPTKDNMTISFDVPNSSQVKVEILDMRGRVVSVVVDNRLLANSYRYTVKNTLSPALYLIKATFNNSVLTEKIEILN